MRAWEDAGVDPVAAQHPPVKTPEDRVVRREILACEHGSRRFRGPVGELRVAQQHAEQKRKQERVYSLTAAVDVESRNGKRPERIHERVRDFESRWQNGTKEF